MGIPYEDLDDYTIEAIQDSILGELEMSCERRGLYFQGDFFAVSLDFIRKLEFALENTTMSEDLALLYKEINTGLTQALTRL